MNNQVKRFQTELDEISQKYSSNFSRLNKEELNWKPDTGSWSIAQVIDHLLVINKTYFKVIEKVREGNYQLPFVGKIGFITNSLGNLILKSVEPERKKKIKTFPVWEPATSNIEKDIVDRFLKQQEDLKELIAESEDLLLKGIIISSPANRLIVYKLEKAFEIIITHEKRHYNQAKEVLKLQKEKVK